MAGTRWVGLENPKETFRRADCGFDFGVPARG